MEEGMATAGEVEVVATAMEAVERVWEMGVVLVRVVAALEGLEARLAVPRIQDCEAEVWTGRVVAGWAAEERATVGKVAALADVAATAGYAPADLGERVRRSFR